MSNETSKGQSNQQVNATGVATVPANGQETLEQKVRRLEMELELANRPSMKAEIKGEWLLIQLLIGKPEKSVTGKSITIASTHGNKRTDLIVNGKPLTIGVNAFIPSDKE